MSACANPLCSKTEYNFCVRSQMDFSMQFAKKLIYKNKIQENMRINVKTENHYCSLLENSKPVKKIEKCTNSLFFVISILFCYIFLL